jgi:hypothetical protein
MKKALFIIAAILLLGSCQSVIQFSDGSISIEYGFSAGQDYGDRIVDSEGLDITNLTDGVVSIHLLRTEYDLSPRKSYSVQQGDEIYIDPYYFNSVSHIRFVGYNGREKTISLNDVDRSWLVVYHNWSIF